jgi:glutathione S-transferase
MKLYWFNSPNPQKVRLALAELGTPCEFELVDLFKGQNRTPGYLALNPTGRAPTLEDDGLILWESNAIVAYLGDRERRMWPLDARDRADALRWMFYAAQHVSDAFTGRVFNMVAKAKLGLPPDHDAIKRSTDAIPGVLAILEAHLAKSRWMLGDEFSLVDCCYLPSLNALEMTHYNLKDYPKVSGYLANGAERPSWQAAGILDFRRDFAIAKPD